jgi:hypothetical protein
VDHLSGLSAIIDVLSWLVALAAVICLWRRDASHYFSNISQYLVRPHYFSSPRCGVCARSNILSIDLLTSLLSGVLIAMAA